MKGTFRIPPGTDHKPPDHLILYWKGAKVGELHDGIAEVYDGMPQEAIDAFIVKGTEIAPD
jgi:hypothetical protein